MAQRHQIADNIAMKLPDLPIKQALPALITALRQGGVAVLQAPPGAGKTTVVPLAILGENLTTGRILMLEPRRLAARTAADRMAQSLGEKTGETVGYRIRGESRTSQNTRIEVVTEGILTRMIQSDPSLEGIGVVIFDEFHERSINADLGLALTWEARSALRDDLLVLVMSATLDADPVATMLNAPVITSQGRSYPVETRLLERPMPKDQRFDHSATDLIVKAVDETTGGVLVFLPGEGEIRRIAERLKIRLPAGCVLQPLYGAMAFADQRAAIAGLDSGRKVVLATAIAETSLTIQDIQVVVDTGRARRARFDPGSGMSRLITERVSRAEADQRRGRAGRISSGICYRMWTRGEAGAMPAFAPAEIETADLAPLVLELALWGMADSGDLALLTPPNPGAFANARTLLTDLGALDQSGRITKHGRRLAKLPLHPRLAHMLTIGGTKAAPLAALLADRDPLPRTSCDLSLRKPLLDNPGKFAAEHGLPFNRAAVERIRAEARRLKSLANPSASDLSWAELAALAYPDRIGQRRKGSQPRWVLSGGKGARIDELDSLSSARFIVATDLDGDTREARIRQAIEISETELRTLYHDRINWHETCVWSRRDRRVVAKRQERLGAITLTDQIWKSAPQMAITTAALDGIRDLGLPATPASNRFRARVALARANGVDLPDMSDAALLDDLQVWLLPHLTSQKTAAALMALDILEPLKSRLTWQQLQELDKIAPPHFTTPMERRIPIDYSAEGPEIAVRLQEMFGLKSHPLVAGKPLRLTLLSPAQKPVQTTMDLPGFWSSSYNDVRKDMRGRYPKHPWPEDPTEAAPTLRANRRRK